MADDLSVIYTDKKLQTLERKLTQTYKQAQRDIKKKTEDFFAKTAERDKLMQERLKAGKMTQDEYDNWRRNKMLYGDNWRAQQESIAKVLADTNKVATAMINAEKADVFAFAGNYTAYQFEHGFGINFGFDLYSEKSVERLLRDNPKILPKKKLDPAKDIPWNMRNVRAQVTQGIIQGESIPKIAKRMSEVVPNRNEHQMVLHARTAMTSAQNGGRMERFKEAERLGIKFKKVWTATLDNRTRDEHRDLDGQAVDPDEPFEIHGEKIMFPGDPDADPSLVYNCRCTVTTELDDYPSSFSRRVQEDGSIIEDQSYREWEASKTGAGQVPETIQTAPEHHEYSQNGTEYGVRQILSVMNPETGELEEYGYTVTKEPEHGFPDGSWNGVYAKRDADIYTLDNGTVFIKPSDLDRKLQAEDVEFFMERYFQVPEDFRDRIQKKVYILDYRNPQDAKWAQRYKMKGFRSYATGGEDITFYAYESHDPDYVTRTFAHEGGHYIDYHNRASRMSESAEWKKAMRMDKKATGNDGVSDYAQVHVHEDFAESMAEYVTNKSLFEEWYPNRATIIRGMLKNG